MWDWALGDETVVALPPTTTLPDPFTVAPPTGLGLSTEEIRTEQGSELALAIKVTWNLVLDVFVTSGGSIEIQFKKSSATNFQPSTFVAGSEIETFIIGVELGVDYDVRIRSVNTLSIESTFSPIVTITVGAAAEGVTVKKDYGFVKDVADIFIVRGGVAETADKTLDYGSVI